MSVDTSKTKSVVVRGEPVVSAVLNATIEVLAHSGYRALSIEEVALRAGVARTTVYRRWPLKADLVRAAIEAMPGAELRTPRGGTLRAQLIEVGSRIARFLKTTHGLAVMRLFTADDGSEELKAILYSIRLQRDAILFEVLRASPELDPEVDVELFVDLLPAALMTRALVAHQPLTRVYIERLVDFLLGSARTTHRSLEPPRRRKEKS